MPPSDIVPDYRKLGRILYVMRATHVLLILAPCAIAANQPTSNYVIPANTTVAAMAVDAAGNTYLTGSTTSTTFFLRPRARFKPSSAAGFARFSRTPEEAR